MSEIRYFMPPVTFFATARGVLTRHPAHVIFRRYQTPSHAACYFIPAEADDWAELYINGGYCEILFSVTSVPQHQHDWHFFERAAANLLEIRGGRMNADVLEHSVLRNVNKRSNAMKLYAALRRAIVAQCERGALRTLSGQAYPDIYYSSDTAAFDLYYDLDHLNEYRFIRNQDPG